jgi:hypothetical protein
MSLLGDCACTALRLMVSATRSQILRKKGQRGGVWWNLPVLLSAVKWGQVVITQKHVVQFKGLGHHIC